MDSGKLNEVKTKIFALYLFSNFVKFFCSIMSAAAMIGTVVMIMTMGVTMRVTVRMTVVVTMIMLLLSLTRCFLFFQKFHNFLV